MSTTDWILVAAFLIGGIVLGNLAGRLTGRFLSGAARPEPIRDASGPLSSLVLWGLVIAGLMAALGIMQPSALEEIPRDLISFLPRMLSAAIIIIGANVVTSFVLAALRPILARSSATVQRQVGLVVKAFIVGLAAVLAVTQIGIDTTVVNLALAALFFGVAASLTLLVGLGGQSVAREVAATRAVRRLVSEGDHVRVDGYDGVIVGIRPTAVELAGADGQRVLIPSSHFIGEALSVQRSEPPS